MAHIAAPTARSVATGRTSPKNGTARGSSSRIAPPSTMPPNAKVRLQKATVRAIWPGDMPQWAYRR